MAKTATRCRAYCLSLTQRPERFANAEAALKAVRINYWSWEIWILNAIGFMKKHPGKSWFSGPLHGFCQEVDFPYLKKSWTPSRCVFQCKKSKGSLGALDSTGDVSRDIWRLGVGVFRRFFEVFFQIRMRWWELCFFGIVWWSLSNTKLLHHTHSIVCFHCDEWMAFWHWCSCFNQGNDFRYLLPDLDALEESLGCRLYRHWPICEAPWRQMTMPRTIQELSDSVFNNMGNERIISQDDEINGRNVSFKPQDTVIFSNLRQCTFCDCFPFFNQQGGRYLTHATRFGSSSWLEDLGDLHVLVAWKNVSKLPLQIGVGTAVHPNPKNPCGCIRKVMPHIRLFSRAFSWGRGQRLIWFNNIYSYVYIWDIYIYGIYI